MMKIDRFMITSGLIKSGQKSLDKKSRDALVDHAEAFIRSGLTLSDWEQLDGESRSAMIAASVRIEEHLVATIILAIAEAMRPADTPVKEDDRIAENMREFVRKEYRSHIGGEAAKWL